MALRHRRNLASASYSLRPPPSPPGRQGKRLADKLVEVTLRDGAPRWVLVHIEVQGRRDKHFAERMFTYNYRIFDRYHRPVASLALLSDDMPGWRPASFHYSLLGCKTGIEFPIAKLSDFAERAGYALDESNPFALVTAAFLAARNTKGDAARRAAEKAHLARLVFLQKGGRRTMIDLIKMIDWAMRLPEELEQQFWRGVHKERRWAMPYMLSIERMGMERGIKKGLKAGLQKGLQQGLQQGLQKGLEKGLEKGLQEGLQKGYEEGARRGQVQLLAQQLRRRFGKLQKKIERRLEKATSAELLAWSAAFVDADTLDEVFQATAK